MDPVCTTLHERFNHYLNTESAALCAVPFKELLPSKHVDGMQCLVFAGGIFLDMIYILQHLDHKRHLSPTFLKCFPPMWHHPFAASLLNIFE